MRRRHRRQRSQAELDITPFMNLMIVLVPVLLLNMVFAHTSILELNFPQSSENKEAPEEAPLQLQVIIMEDQLVVADNHNGVIQTIPKTGDGQDYQSLSRLMQQLKTRLPDHRSIAVLASRGTPYQTLVTVMDRVRSYDTVVAGSVVEAELFPQISIGDAPVADSDNGKSS